jgi:hypothetical protein
MSIAKITRKLLMNWYALTFCAIFTLGLTGALGLTAARRTSFRPSCAVAQNDLGNFLDSQNISSCLRHD